MKGTLQDFSVAENRGWITGDDGARYSFMGPEWKGAGVPMAGGRVDFEVMGDAALAVTPESQPALAPAPLPTPMGAPPAAPAMSSGPAKVDKTTAGICAILLGSLGIHKFIMGFQTEGIIMLAVSLGLGIPTCGASSGLVWIIGVIEGVIYLTMTQEDFERTYIQGKKKWF